MGMELTVTRPQETAEDMIIRECAMMGEIKRRREENARLKAEIDAHEARRKRERAALAVMAAVSMRQWNVAFYWVIVAAYWALRLWEEKAR